MYVVNLYGAPGVGKSTLAARLFSDLKFNGYNAELCTEFAKDLVWEKRFDTLADQIYVFAKQNHKLFRLQNQVDVAITDSPLLLSMYYGCELPASFANLVLDTYNSMNNIDLFITRNKPYNPSGRLQTEDQAKLIDEKILNILNTYDKNKYVKFLGKECQTESILSYVISVMNNGKEV